MKVIITRDSFFKKLTSYVLLLFAIVLLSLGSPLSKNVTILYIFLSILIFLNLVYLNFTKLKKIDLIASLIFLFWIILNVISSFFNKVSISLNEIVGYMTIFLISYFLMRYIGKSFFFRFEKIVYILTFLSIPLFLTNCFFPNFFVDLSPIFRPFTDSFYTDRFPNYWYAFIYTHDVIVQDVTLLDLRNSGFMWEPGAFAMIIIMMILYNWLGNGINFKKKNIIYFIALITTFSTAGYISLCILIVIYIYNKNKNKNRSLILLTVIVVLTYPIALNTNILGGKINSYLEENQKKELSFDNSKDIYEINRYSAFLLKSYRFFQYPLGYGVVKPQMKSEILNMTNGVNGLGEILVRWGFVGFLFLFFSIFNYIKSINRLNYPNIIVLLSVAIISVLFFSNPIENHYILYFVLLYPYNTDNNKVNRHKIYFSQQRILSKH